MIGCWVLWKCLVAWWFGELSQQPTWPHVRQSRRCTHIEPVFRHSSQPSALGVTFRMPAAWTHSSAMGSSGTSDDGGAIAGVGQKLVDRRDHLRALADRGGDPLGRARAHVADREHAVAARLE